MTLPSFGSLHWSISWKVPAEFSPMSNTEVTDGFRRKKAVTVVRVHCANALTRVYVRHQRMAMRSSGVRTYALTPTTLYACSLDASPTRHRRCYCLPSRGAMAIGRLWREERRRPPLGLVQHLEPVLSILEITGLLLLPPRIAWRTRAATTAKADGGREGGGGRRRRRGGRSIQFSGQSRTTACLHGQTPARAACANSDKIENTGRNFLHRLANFSLPHERAVCR